MDFGTLLNCILIAAGAMCFAGSISYRIEQKRDRISAMVFLMGCFATVWCEFAGIIGFAGTDILKEVFHRFQIIGIIGFFTTEFYLIGRLLKFPRRMFISVYVLLIVLGVVDMVLYGRNVNFHYVDVGGRTAYTMLLNYRIIFHLAYMTLIVLFYAHATVLYSKAMDFKRERRMAWAIFLINFLIVLTAIPDTLLPIFGIPSIPTSGVGAVIAHVFICLVISKNNTYSISIRNLSKYIYNSANVGVMVFDNHLQLVTLNVYAQKLIGLEEPFGKYAWELMCEDEASFNDLYARAVKGEEFKKKAKSLDKERMIEMNPSVIKDSHGDPYCMLLSVYDVTQAEEMIQEVVRANEAKSHFLANMSHEVRTPINAVLGINEITMRESKEPDTLGRATDIDRAAKSLLAIVNDVLDFSKMESGRMELTIGNYELYSILNDSYNMIQFRASEKKLRVVMDCDPQTPCLLQGDEVRIRQVISNLLSNAVKFTAIGSITFHVGFENLEEDRVTLVISVKDTGSGIKEEDIPKLFTSFERMDEVKHRTISGTGLGLAIVKNLLDMMGGSAEVKSVYGQGSEFIVRIPQKKMGEQRLGDVNSRYLNFGREVIDASKVDASVIAPDAHILVVDDVSMNLRVFKGLLKNTQIQVDTAEGGAQALELLQKNHYDVIFMDHMMPEMDGIEVFHRLQAIEGNPNQYTPVIMLTANAVAGVEEEYLKEGFTAYMPKPIQSKRLENMIAQLLPKELLKNA